MVGDGGCFFQIAKRMNNFDGHGCSRANLEILQRTLSLRPPVFIGRYFNLAHGVCFYSEIHDFFF